MNRQEQKQTNNKKQKTILLFSKWPSLLSTLILATRLVSDATILSHHFTPIPLIH